jgi:hypothetical protein
MHNITLNTGHEYGNMGDIMEVVEHKQKGSHINTALKRHICYNNNKIKQNLVLNDNLREQTNPIFEVCEK